MKSFLQLQRQFLMPFNGHSWLPAMGLVVLPVLMVVGLFFRRVAFGMAVWDYVLLLAIPFMFTPKVLRTLICNRRLALVPGFAARAVLAAFVFTLLQASFLGFFAWLYDIEGFHLRNAAQLFIISSAYVAVMQYAVTTAWAMVALSVLPVTCIAALLFLMQDRAQVLVSNDHLAWLLVVSLLGWLLAGVHSRGRHHFKPEHKSLENYKSSGYQRAPLASWLFAGSNALADPDATLLLGYPATLTTRLRVLIYLVFLGPMVFTVFLTLVGFGADWSWRPSPLEIFIGASLFPAAFAAFQNLEWVNRLRFIWLRRRTLRNELWQLLEKQLAINVALLMVPCSVLMLLGLLFSQLPPALLLHYPMLILVFNLFYAYYVACARTSAWPPFWGVLLSFVGSFCIFGGLWVAIVWHNTTWLYGLEALVIVGGVIFRMMARKKLENVDWLVVRPLPARNAQ